GQIERAVLGEHEQAPGLLALGAQLARLSEPPARTAAQDRERTDQQGSPATQHVRIVTGARPASSRRASAPEKAEISGVARAALGQERAEVEVDREERHGERPAARDLHGARAEVAARG